MITEKEKEIIKILKTVLGYDASEITQEQFDNMVDYIMENETDGGNPKELIWRLSGCYEYLSLNKVIDIYVDSRDAYYTSELVSYVNGNLDQEYLTKKMIETNDLKFIDEAMSNAGNAVIHSLDEKYLNEIRDFYNSKISKRKDENMIDINNKKKEYIEYAKKTFKGKALDIVLHNINKFYEDVTINKTKYSIGEDVYLKKGTFIHGIFGGIENFDYTLDNGFISVDFTSESRANKICNSVGMWNIKENMLLKDYIDSYSGFTITYTIGRGPDSKEVSELIPYHKFDEYTEKINNDDNIWTYWGIKTKEVSFIPSLVSDKRQIAFILNMESEYAKELAYADVWNTEFEGEILESFLDSRYYPKFLEERFNRNASTTDRESAIMFGLPSTLIEGVFVGRKLEKDKKSIEYIKSKLPECYICNLDGKVIVGNNK